MDSPIAYFNSNDGNARLAFGQGKIFKFSHSNSLEHLQGFIDDNKGKHILLMLSYDLKNSIEELESNNPNYSDFPLGYAWCPEFMVDISHENVAFIQGEKNIASLEFIDRFLEEEINSNFDKIQGTFQSRISEQEYLTKVKKLQEEIQQGNIYEVNYCQEFFTENVEINNVLNFYFQLNSITKAPFSSLFSIDNHTVFCGSPERFLNRLGDKMISEPIKGTCKRGKNKQEDEKLKNQLENDPKERAENVMIVDLVRNDLSKIAQKGSVEVEELCKIYSFETVHQMISKIACQVRPEISFTDILRATFPMGSMTGAPKISAMELIDEHEDFQRGIYSGSIGYICPNGDFDLNVVIRSLVYNNTSKYLSCAVGGAITIQSDPEKELEECYTKVKSILDGIQG